MPSAQLKKSIGDDTNGDHFEDFCNALCSRKYGTPFRPLGNKKDGGKDGIFKRHDKTKRIYQFSIEKTPAKKIAKTMARLKDSLTPADYKNFSELYYFTNQSVKDAETIETEFEKDYGKNLRVYDLNWIMANLESGDGTLQIAGDHYLSDVEPLFDNKINQEVYVFFSLMTSGGDGLIDHTLDLRARALDALILQELRDTSVENRMPRSELNQRLLVSCPWTKERIVNASLERLNKKHSKTEGVRLINWHRKEDELCLPHETVCEVRDRRLEAVALCDYVAGKVKDFLNEYPTKSSESERVWPIVQEYLAKVFSTRGSYMLDWVDNQTYTLGKSDVDLLSATLLDRGIRSKPLVQTYQYVLARLLESRGDAKIMTFLSRLNEAYLLHLIAGRDVKVHNVLDNMKRGLSLVCCSSIMLPQLADFIQTQKQSILQHATDAGINLQTTEAFLEEVRYQLKDSLRFDHDPNSVSNDFTALAIASGKTVRQLFSDIGLNSNLGNLTIVLKTLFGIQVIPPLDTTSEPVLALTKALMPMRRNQYPRALADASAFYYIKRHQDKARDNFQTWWLTRETATVKMAIERGIPVDERVYMRLGFLQDVLLLPNREDIESKPTVDWARDTLILSAPTDSLPNDLLGSYRKARKEFSESHKGVNRIRMLEKMHAFMALGALNDKFDA